MCVADTEKTLTVDANIVKLYFQWREESTTSPHYEIVLEAFCPCILERYPIAMNDFIKTECEGEVNPKDFGLWYKMRVSKPQPLVKEVPMKPLSRSVIKTLRDNYKFYYESHHHGKDAKYVKTCLNTTCKLLVTEDSNLYLPHKSGKKRPPMDRFLRKQLGIAIMKIDECCDNLLGKQGE